MEENKFCTNIIVTSYEVVLHDFASKISAGSKEKQIILNKMMLRIRTEHVFSMAPSTGGQKKLK